VNPEQLMREVQTRMDLRDGVSPQPPQAAGSPDNRLFWLKQQQATLSENQDRFGRELVVLRRGFMGRIETLVKRLRRRLLGNFAKPQREFNAAVSRFLGQNLEYLETANAELAQLRAENAALRERLDLAAAPLDPAAYLDRVDPPNDRALRPIVASFEGCQRVLHLGCANGRLLALLAEAGIPAHGVTASATWAAACRSRGLEVVHQPILEHLGQLSEVSAIFLSGQLERLDRLAALDLLRLVASRLSIGGTLIVQTPNPLCHEAARAFYRHPGNRFPLDPELLRYLGEQAELTFVHFCFTDALTDQPEQLQLETVLDQPAAQNYRMFSAVLRKLDQQ